MSANNCLLIIRHNNRVLMIDADTNFVLDDYGEYETIDKAIDKATQIMEDEEVEYNILFRNQ